MNFNDHSSYRDSHALLSASKYHWLNYSDDKMMEYFSKVDAAKLGTRLHAFAAEAIELRQKLPKSRRTLNMYVNDCIGYKMTPEVILMYSPILFGTADAVSFRKNRLRIFDLKTGIVPAHMEQLLIYASLFWLEYGYYTGSIEIELRIYQNDEVFIFEPEPEDMAPIIDKIISAEKLFRSIEE